METMFVNSIAKGRRAVIGQSADLEYVKKRT